MITVANYNEKSKSIVFADLPPEYKKGDDYMNEFGDLYGEDSSIDSAIDKYIASLNTMVKDRGAKHAERVEKFEKAGAKSGIKALTVGQIQNKTQGSIAIDVSKLVVEKENPQRSIDNARIFMEGAAKGENGKRGAIKVRKLENGEYLVLDGNATTVAAKQMGIKQLYAQVEKSAAAKKPAAKKPAATKAPVDNYTRERYKGVFGDYDGDGILNVDDPNPMKAGDTETVEEVKLSDEIAALIDFRKSYDVGRTQFVKTLQDVAEGESDILSRTKTPYSIINKLRRKRLVGEHGISDVVGTMVVFPDQEKLEAFRDKVNAGAFGKVLEYEDFYKKPLAGYKAYHWNIVHNGIPIEIQAKTERMKHIANENHTLYKEGRNDGALLLKLTNEMEKADRGDLEAAKRIDALIADRPKLLSLMTAAEKKEVAAYVKPDKLTKIKAKANSKKVTKEQVLKKTNSKKPVERKQGKVRLFDEDLSANTGRKGLIKALVEKEAKAKKEGTGVKFAPRDRKRAEEEIRKLITETTAGKDELTTQEVIALGRRINAERSLYSQFMDLDADHKTVRWPTEKNVKIWAANPGKSDLMGVDTNKNVKATVGKEKGKSMNFWMM